MEVVGAVVQWGVPGWAPSLRPRHSGALVGRRWVLTLGDAALLSEPGVSFTVHLAEDSSSRADVVAHWTCRDLPQVSGLQLPEAPQLLVLQLRGGGGVAPSPEASLPLAEPCRGLRVLVEATPFARMAMFNSWSRGMLGAVNGSLLLIDAPTAPGCEGAPIFLHVTDGQRRLLGLVLATGVEWRGERLSFTVGLALLPVLRAVQAKLPFALQQVAPQGSLSDVPGSESVVLVSCGSSWGSGVSLGGGLVLTCSHVVTEVRSRITVSWRSLRAKATLVFRTPDDQAFDVALLRLSGDCFPPPAIRRKPSEPLRKGEAVFGAGFSVSSREGGASTALLLPTVTRGVVAHVAPSMLQTTCCIHSGCSGGAILRPSGELVALVVCNVKDENGGKQLFPRVNMAVPFAAISNIIDAYTADGDLTVLQKLKCDDDSVQKLWRLEDPVGKSKL